MKFKNYKSAANLSDYTEGAAYAFYMHNNSAGDLVRANEEDVQKYAYALSCEGAEDNTHGGKWMAFVRVCGVVVDKLKATEECKLDRIKVMFKTTGDDYVINTYAVGIHNVFTNDMTDIQPTAMIELQVI